ncbi:hypothetical protein [Paenibacillus sinensis]|nr:hypothetical protein [Paenibacillus sinensis]
MPDEMVATCPGGFSALMPESLGLADSGRSSPGMRRIAPPDQ